MNRRMNQKFFERPSLVLCQSRTHDDAAKIRNIFAALTELPSSHRHPHQHQQLKTLHFQFGLFIPPLQDGLSSFKKK